MDLDSILHKDIREVHPRGGQLLLSEPLMADHNFSRSAVMLLEQDSTGGHIGLMLNKGPVCQLNQLIEGLPAEITIPIFKGGPVELDRLFMLHRLGNIFSNSMEIAPGLYVGGTEDEVIGYIISHGGAVGDIRFFIGYSGWGAGQLTSEIIKNYWALNTDPDTSELLSGSGDAFWRREVEKLGPDYRSWLIVPENPSLN